MTEKALIAMSGGVDSSVAAYLMKQKGFDCIGVTMKLYTNDDIGVNRSKTCCSLDDVEDARSVAFKLKIPYYVFNFTSDFKERVIEPFISSYENGATPNPCVDCNRYLKFESLYNRAKELNCRYVVTGHYAKIEEKDGRLLLKKADNLDKDQSYVLSFLTQEQLKHTLFPLGTINDKDETRRIAEEQGFFNSDKPDSQDICFVPDGDYAAFIRRFTGKTYKPGNFCTTDGKVLGKHKGIINYTLGQRRGLGIAAEKPLYVTEILPKENKVVLGGNEELFKREFDAKDFNYIAFDEPQGSFRAKAKVRYRQKEQWATVEVIGKNRVHVTFDEPQRAITKGQTVALYDGDTVIGGGIIE